MRDSKTPPSPCRSCGKVLDAATGLKKTPKPGSLSICAYCGELSEFDENMTLQPLALEDLPEDVQEEIKKYREVLKRVNPRYSN